jgi:hypothetical protein
MIILYLEVVYSTHLDFWHCLNTLRKVYFERNLICQNLSNVAYKYPPNESLALQEEEGWA